MPPEGQITPAEWRTERLDLDQLTSDPANPQPGDEWLRVDQKPTYEDANGNSRTAVAEYRRVQENGTTITAPVAQLGDATAAEVIDKIRTNVTKGGSPTGKGFIPYCLSTSSPSYPKRRLQHPVDGQVGLHDALTVSTIYDSVVNRWKLANNYTDSVGVADGKAEDSPTFVSNANAIGDYELDLDGSNDGVKTPNSTPSGDMTMLITVDFSSSISSNERLINSDDGSSGQRILGFTDQGTDTIESTAANDSGTFYNVTHQLPSTGRYRLGFVLDASTELRVASQGSVQSKTSVSGSFSDTGIDFALGYKRRTDSEYFGGIIDDAIVADEAYTSQQLQDDYDRQPWS